MVNLSSHCLWSSRRGSRSDTKLGHNVRIHFALALHFLERFVDLSLLYDRFLGHLPPLHEYLFLLVFNGLGFGVVS